MTQDLFSLFIADALGQTADICNKSKSLPADTAAVLTQMKAIKEQVSALASGANFIAFSSVEKIADSMERLAVKAVESPQSVTEETLSLFHDGCLEVDRLLRLRKRDATLNGDVYQRLSDYIDRFPRFVTSSPVEQSVSQNKKSVTEENHNTEATDLWSTNDNDAFIALSIAGKHYAVPLFQVSEMRSMKPWTMLPYQPTAVMGLINLRGKILPLIDLRVLLHLSEKPSGEGVIVILKIDSALQAFVVDAVINLVHLKKRERRAAPRLGESPSKHIRFIGEDERGDFLLVLDVRRALIKEGIV